jgi:hypothetical protein
MNIRLFRQAPLRHGWKLWSLIFFAAPVCGVFAQASLNILFTNGPASNRINVVVFSEGYQTNQLAQFLTNAAAAVSNLLSVSPYTEYSNYFNAYAVAVASVHSGSNHSGSYTNNTYFKSIYNSDGIPQLITIPPNSFDSSYSDGTGKVQALLTNQALYAATNLLTATNVLNWITPSNRFVVLVVNDTNYGGSGQPPNPTNPLPIAVTSLGSSNGIPASQIIVHESGHTIGGLADEYTNAYPMTPVERPNATATNTPSHIPWIAWITNYDENTFGYTPQIPTPADEGDVNLVGLFEGSEYNTTGWYRPMEDCIMNHLYENLGFCHVCQEALVKAIYQKIRSIDSFAPATNNNTLTLASTNAFLFSIVPLQPATHSLSLQWFTNSVAVPGATNGSFALFPRNFTNGPCSIQAQAFDPTGLVLDDPDHYLSNSVSWNVTIGLTALQIVSPRWLANGQFTFTVAGTAPYGFVIQASTNLASWVSLSTNALSGGLFNYTNAAGFSQRYYRTVFTP